MPKSSYEPAVSKYLDQVGVRWPTSMEAFARQMRQKHGAALDKLMSLLGRGGGPTPEFYALKNHSLRFSLDITFQYDGNFYAEYLSGVVVEHRTHQPRPRRVLDLGCDNGLLTCFYAQHFPEAEVIGIDAANPVFGSLGGWRTSSASRT